jgi:hypothetical protein
MDVNQSGVLASDLFLVQNWNLRTEPPTQRRNAIFHDFVKLGMRGRWTWYSKAEICEFSHFTTEERRILERRDWPTRCVAGLIGEDLRRVVMVDHAQSLSDTDVVFRTDLEGDNRLVCRHNGNPNQYEADNRIGLCLNPVLARLRLGFKRQRGVLFALDYLVGLWLRVRTIQTPSRSHLLRSKDAEQLL